MILGCSSLDCVLARRHKLLRSCLKLFSHRLCRARVACQLSLLNFQLIVGLLVGQFFVPLTRFKFGLLVVVCS
jgi:hypothetical protein